MKTENFFTGPLSILNSARSHSQSRNQSALKDFSTSLLTSDNLKRYYGTDYLDKKTSVCSGASVQGRGKRARSTRNISMKSSKGVTKKTKTMDYTNYAYNEAVGRLKLMLADSYAAPSKGSSSYLRHINDDSTDNQSDNLSVIERPVFADISKYLSPGYKSRFGGGGGSFRQKKRYDTVTSSKENLATPTHYQPIAMPPREYLLATKPPVSTDSVQAPVEIFNFIEKQEDYIEQLEKESKFCRSELSQLLGKVKEVINENEQLTEHARSEFAAHGGGGGGGGNMKKPNISPSSDSDEQHIYVAKKSTAMKSPRKEAATSIKSPRFANAPSIVYEARISELEAELMQAQIDLKRVKTENEELKRKLAHTDPLAAITGSTISTALNCETHRKQIEHLQMDKNALEETIRHLQKSLDDAKAQQYNVSSKRYINDLMQMERSQAELEVKHLRDELDRQHERVRELQHEMARRIAEERSNAERRYNNQVDQLGGDLSNQWEQVAKLQLDLERQKRYETDIKRDLSQRNAQIDELKMELKSNRSTFLADMAQASAEKQSLEQEITSLRLQLDRSAREAKTEAARLNAEISSLRQRLDRGDADLLHSKREVLRLNDEISNLEKELAYGEMKNEIRPTKKDLDKRISEMQDKHAETVNELEEMIQNQKQLMDKLTNECKILTNKLEDTTLKHNQEKQHLRETNEKLMERLKQIWASYKELNASLDERRRLSLERAEAMLEKHNGSLPSELDTYRAEHFESADTIDLEKPLSTTSRPRMVQPIPQSMITKPPPTAMSPYLANHPPPPISYQQQRQQQFRRHQSAPAMIIATGQSMNPTQQHQQPTRESATTTTQSAAAVTTTLESTMTTMRILKTKWEWEKNNNSSSSSSSINVANIKIPQHSQAQPTKASSLPMTATKSTVPPNPHTEEEEVGQQPSIKQRSIQTWPQPAITIQTIAPTETTISSSMTPALTIPTMISNMTQISSNIPPTNMIQRDKPATRVTRPVPQTMINQVLPINMISQQAQHRSQHSRHSPLKPSQQDYQQQLQHHRRQQKSNQRNHLHHPSYHQQQQQQQRHRRQLLGEESPRSQRVAQQQRAAHNRERAVALWGQLEREQSAAENPFCHNSLPRQQPKSSFAIERFAQTAAGGGGAEVVERYDVADDDGSEECFKMIDPFELEFSISSPSLMRSCGSNSGTDVAVDADDFDSISEMSISPAQTAIRRITSGETQDDAATVIITERKEGGNTPE